MKQYTDLLRQILEKGRRKKNRTGVETISLLGPQMEFDMDEGFPLVTERPIFFRGIKVEDLWFIEGTCNNEALMAQDVKIWNNWALKEDYTREIARDLPALVSSYVELRRKQEEELGVEPTFTREMAVRELAHADKADFEAGKPVMGRTLGVQSIDELCGSFGVLREAGVKMTETQLLMPRGHLGPIYGVLWRRWMSDHGVEIDQLQNVFDKLASDNEKLRYSRANIVTSFNPAVLPDETVSAEENIKNGKQALAACHTMFQFFAEPLTLAERLELYDRKLEAEKKAHFEGGAVADVDWMELTADTLYILTNIRQEDFTEDNGHDVLDKLDIPRDQLSLKLYQRSADFPVGVPFNIAGYALILHLFSAQLNMKPARFIHTFGDAHIYVDQIEGVKDLLARVEACDGEVPAMPKLVLRKGVKSIFDYKPDDIQLENYAPLKPDIKFAVAI